MKYILRILPLLFLSQISSGAELNLIATTSCEKALSDAGIINLDKALELQAPYHFRVPVSLNPKHISIERINDEFLLINKALNESAQLEPTIQTSLDDEKNECLTHGDSNSSHFSRLELTNRDNIQLNFYVQRTGSCRTRWTGWGSEIYDPGKFLPSAKFKFKVIANVDGIVFFAEYEYLAEVPNKAFCKSYNTLRLQSVSRDDFFKFKTLR